MKSSRAMLFLLFLGASVGLPAASAGHRASSPDGVLPYGFGGTEETQDSSMRQDSLAGAITRGLELLHAKRYVDFLKMFMKPDDLKELTEHESIDAVAAKFSEEIGGNVFEVFRRIKDLKPTMDADGTTATFVLPGKGVDGENEFKFLRIGKNWYLEE